MSQLCNFVCRSTGIHGSFNNHGKGEQTLAEAEITSHDGAFTSSFNNRKDGKQDFRKAKIKRYCVYNMLLNMCLILIFFLNFFITNINILL